MADTIRNKFYKMADSQSKNWEWGRAIRILDTLGMNCSPDHYDEILARHCQEAIDDIRRMDSKSPWIALLQETRDVAIAQQIKTNDLRGFKKNIHTVR